MASVGSNRLSARTLSDALSDRAHALVDVLLPNGTRLGRTWRVGSLAGESGQSLGVQLAGPRRGRWRDYNGGARGDALDLVAQVLFRGDTGAACRWARDWLGLGQLDDEQSEQMQRRAAAAREQRQRQAETAADRQALDAKRLWLAARPMRVDDIGWRYLTGRGIELDLLPEPPAALRVHPALWNAESGRAWPALVAAICDPDGRHVNTHRIWLAPQAAGGVTKAPLDRPKLSMPGGYGGGCVRLWRGASTLPWRAMPPGETVLAGEGVEDVLTIVCARPEWRACAVLSVSSIGGLVLPEAVSRLIWIAQNDAPGSPAQATLVAALQRHREAGRSVAVIRPPPWVKDVNELAMRFLADAMTEAQ